jgi:hypothetical protein
MSLVEVCYCDSEAAWRLAVERGLSPNAIIRTTNPALLMNPPEGATVEPVEKTWTPEKIEALSAGADSLILNIRKIVGSSSYFKYMDLLVRDAFVWTYRIPWAITLDDADLIEPRAVISIDYGNSLRHMNGHAQWANLLTSNPGLVTLTYQASELAADSPDPPLALTRWQLLKYYPFSHVEYTLWRRLWQTLPRSLSRGTLYVGIDNPSIRETLVQFARRGYAICETQRPRTSGKAGEVADDLRALIEPLLREYLKPWVKADIQNTLISLFFEDFAKSMGEFDDAMSRWTRIIAGWKKEKPVAFLSNIILPTVMLAVRGCLRSAGIPLVLFQHGHSRELTRYLEFSKCLSEETFGDLFFCYDDKAYEFVNANRHRVASVMTSGVPELYHLNQRHIPDDECGDIGYIQTGIPVSNRAHPFTMTWTDLQKDQFETSLFEQCFSRLPHTVTIKPYLAPDYPGERKSIEVANRSPNLNVYSKDVDLRYVAGNFRLLITSRATSTLGWCVLANRPMVYLDLPYQYPLWDDAREALEKAVFYFDMSQPDALQKLRDFLSQPLDVIERKWTERADARQRFIGRYMDSGPPRFGRRTFIGIRNYLNVYHGAPVPVSAPQAVCEE